CLARERLPAYPRPLRKEVHAGGPTFPVLEELEHELLPTRGEVRFGGHGALPSVVDEHLPPPDPKPCATLRAVAPLAIDPSEAEIEEVATGDRDLDGTLLHQREGVGHARIRRRQAR